MINLTNEALLILVCWCVVGIWLGEITTPPPAPDPEWGWGGAWN